MASYSSDQLVATLQLMHTMVPTGQRARLTGIQAEGASGSKIIFKMTGGAVWNCNSYFEFGSEGIDFYVPGSGILFEDGIYLDLTATPSVTITFT